MTKCCSVLSLALVLCLFPPVLPADETPPVRIGIAGLVHDHVHGILNQLARPGAVEIVGIAEQNPAVVARFKEQYSIPEKLLFKDLESLIAETKPSAVMAFTSTFDHKKIVEDCAPHGVHVMMEKPLAVSVEHGKAMADLAEKHDVHLMVNYETTWYRSNHAAFDLVREQKAIGEIRKVVVMDGHEGPVEIGCSEAFLAWLTDPVLNGGGALTDFGCYGANLMTWLMGDARPISVSAVTQQIKPDVYPRVDDEATIVLTYPRAQAIIQASWNWPFNRKDMEVYGRTGYAHTAGHYGVRLKTDSGPEKLVRSPARKAPHDRETSYLAAVVRGELQPEGLSSLKNNLIVTEILEAARESAGTGKVVSLSP